MSQELTRLELEDTKAESTAPCGRLFDIRIDDRKAGRELMRAGTVVASAASEQPDRRRFTAPDFSGLLALARRKTLDSPRT